MLQKEQGVEPQRKQTVAVSYLFLQCKQLKKNIVLRTSFNQLPFEEELFVWMPSFTTTVLPSGQGLQVYQVYHV